MEKLFLPGGAKSSVQFPFFLYSLCKLDMFFGRDKFENMYALLSTIELNNSRNENE